MISTASSTLSRQPGDSIESVDLQGQLALVNAATRTGIGRFIFVSFRDDPTVQYPLTQAKRSVEQAIVDLDFTSIQASPFMEVWLSPVVGFDYLLGKARIYGSGSNPISFVSYRDVAEFCIAPLLRPVASRSVLEVGGPEPLSPLEVVKIFEEESGEAHGTVQIAAFVLRGLIGQEDAMKIAGVAYQALEAYSLIQAAIMGTIGSFTLVGGLLGAASAIQSLFSGSGLNAEERAYFRRIEASLNELKRMLQTVLATENMILNGLTDLYHLIGRGQAEIKTQIDDAKRYSPLWAASFNEPILES